MKKQTIAAGIGLACGLACAPAFAQDSGESSATFYGIADFAMVNFSNQTTTGTGTRNYMLSGLLSTSRWGIRGREDLGGGTATVYNLESLADFTTSVAGKGQLFDRAAYVGFTNNAAGELTLGCQQNLVTDAIDKIDAFGGQSASFNPNNAYIGGNAIGDNSTTFFGPAGATMARTNNAVKYNSRGLLGEQFGFSLLYGAGGVAGDTGVSSDWGGQLRVNVFGATAIAAYMQYRNSSTATAQYRKDTLIGISYLIGDFVVRAGWGQSKEDVTAPTTSIPSAGVGYAFTPRLSGDLAYYWMRVSNSTTATGVNGKDGRAMAVLRYAFSKRTDVYVEGIFDSYSSGKTISTTNASTSSSLFALGLRHRF